MDRRRADELTRSYFAAYQVRPLAVPVELARHLVFGAVAYARSLGFAPAAGFEATAGHLGPWAGPSAIGFGRDGKPYFVQGPTITPQPSWRPWRVPSGGTTFTSSSSAHSCAGRLVQRGHGTLGHAAWVLNTYPCRSTNDRPSAKVEVHAVPRL
jgi:hypothetical protein